MNKERDHHGNHDNERRLFWAMLLTGVFMVAEVIGGVVSGSLALLSDAGHMLADFVSLALAWFAFRLGGKKPDLRRSYGYHRFQVLAAFINGLSLLVIVGWILFEAAMRLIEPPEVIGRTMLIIASAGLVVNIFSFLVLHGGDQENLNIRGAALHVLGDLLGSVAAIIAALVIIQTGWMPIDPILSVLVALLILRSAWQLVKRSAHILLEGAPEWLDCEDMQQKIIAVVPEVTEIHHVHVWGLTPQHPMLTMHVVLGEEPMDPTPVVRQIKEVLKDRFAIDHSTIEVEFGDCADH